jgi:hypothetical protein
VCYDVSEAVLSMSRERGWGQRLAYSTAQQGFAFHKVAKRNESERRQNG